MEKFTFQFSGSAADFQTVIHKKVVTKSIGFIPTAECMWTTHVH